MCHLPSEIAFPDPSHFIPIPPDDFVTLGMLPKDSDKAEVVPALTGVFAEALRDGVSNLSFGDLSAQLGTTM